jgi:hypothetical protein
LSVFSNLVSVPRIRKSTLSSVVRFLSPFSFRSVSFPSSSQSSSLRIRLDIFNVFLTISSIHSNPSPPCLSAVSTFVLVSISSMSSLQYRRYTLIRLLPPLLLSRLHLRTRLDIHVNVFLQYRRYALQFRSFPLSSPPFPLHFRRQFSTFLSRRLRQCTLVLRFRLLLILLGAPSFSSPFSMSSLQVMSLRRLRRCLRDRPRHFVISSSPSRLFVLLPFRPSTLCNCSTRTSNPCCQCSSIRFPPFPRSPSFRLFSSPLFADILTFTCR